MSFCQQTNGSCFFDWWICKRYNVDELKIWITQSQLRFWLLFSFDMVGHWTALVDILTLHILTDFKQKLVTHEGM